MRQSAVDALNDIGGPESIPQLPGDAQLVEGQRFFHALVSAGGGGRT